MIEAGECLKIRQLNEADFGGGCKLFYKTGNLMALMLSPLG
jgi:hypothetical protein